MTERSTRPDMASIAGQYTQRSSLLTPRSHVLRAVSLQFRERVFAVRTDRQRPYPAREFNGQWRVEVGKQFAAARPFPFQRGPEDADRHGDEDQIRNAVKMSRRGLAHLRRRGEVDEAVSHIERRTAERTSLDRFGPQAAGQNLVDRRAHAVVQVPQNVR